MLGAGKLAQHLPGGVPTESAAPSPPKEAPKAEAPGALSAEAHHAEPERLGVASASLGNAETRTARTVSILGRVPEPVPSAPLCLAGIRRNRGTVPGPHCAQSPQ